MAFGKDPKHLSTIPNYGGNFVQKSRMAIRRRQSSGTSGGKPFWKDNFRPPELYSTIVRILPGQYEQFINDGFDNAVKVTAPFVKYREHTTKFNGRIRSGICSAGPLYENWKLREDCVGCKLDWEDYLARKEIKRQGGNPGSQKVSSVEKYAYSVWDYAAYFKIPQTDKSGQPRMNPKTNQPYYDWATGDPNDPRFHGAEHIQGHALAWACGSSYQAILVDKAVQIGNSCANCGSRDSITAVVKMCGNKNCGHPIYEPDNTTLTAEQRKRIDEEPYTCPSCGEKNPVDELIECANCTPQGGEARRAQLWDVDLQVQLLQAGDRKMLQIHSYSDPRPIQINDPEIMKRAQPLDLIKQFAPTPREKQEELWGQPSDQAGALPASPQPAGALPSVPYTT